LCVPSDTLLQPPAYYSHFIVSFQFITADAGEPGLSPTSPQPSSSGRFKRTFSFRRRERQESQSSTPAKEPSHAKVQMLYAQYRLGNAANL